MGIFEGKIQDPEIADTPKPRFKNFNLDSSMLVLKTVNRIVVN